jgi:hypothetical protein
MEKTSKSKDVSYYIFGNRFYSDQTMYEYLVEFLNIFNSPKQGIDDYECMHFHSVSDYVGPGVKGTLSYQPDPRMGLRRFIFFDNSKRTKVAKIDGEAYQAEIKAVEAHFVDTRHDVAPEIVESMQDLLHGFAIIVKNRSWCAQSTLPICKELVLCEAMPKTKIRSELTTLNDPRVDTEFDFDKRNFLSRGGELYYLHLLEALKDQPDKQALLEEQLGYIMTRSCEDIGIVADNIQKIWDQRQGYDINPLRRSSLYLGWYPEGRYGSDGRLSVDELTMYLSNNMDAIKRIDILAKGVMLQVMRMMQTAVTNYLGTTREPWIMDMKGDTTGTVRKLAVASYNRLENQFLTALNRAAVTLLEETGESKSPENIVKVVSKGRKNSLMVFRSKGKEIGCIIPAQGPYGRFSMSEDVAIFLVLSLLAPGQKMTLTAFLEELYKHYHIVIGAEQYEKYVEATNTHTKSLVNSFVQNQQAFQDFLKEIGLLRELSDATSIVVNPYVAMKY